MQIQSFKQFLEVKTKYTQTTRQMISQSKRSLRVRKDPKYLNSDEQDPDKVSLFQLKSTYDNSTSQAQKVQDAKVLTKLINKINKSYSEYAHQKKTQQANIQKPLPPQKPLKTQNVLEGNKKPLPTPKQTKKQPVGKAPKTMYNLKNQYSTNKQQQHPQVKQQQQQLPKYSQSYMNQLKQLSLPIQGMVNKGIFTDQLKKLQSLYPDMKNISYQTLTQNTNPNLFSGLGPVSQVKVRKQTQPQQAKSHFNEEKLFKRSAYHVAIAYHIYLKNLKEKGGPIGSQIDPTYHARKLKQSQGH